jgi:hypothetical protein
MTKKPKAGKAKEIAKLVTDNFPKDPPKEMSGEPFMAMGPIENKCGCGLRTCAKCVGGGPFNVESYRHNPSHKSCDLLTSAIVVFFLGLLFWDWYYWSKLWDQQKVIEIPYIIPSPPDQFYWHSRFDACQSDWRSQIAEIKFLKRKVRNLEP